jgi:hypothetical protein
MPKRRATMSIFAVNRGAFLKQKPRRITAFAVRTSRVRQRSTTVGVFLIDCRAVIQQSTEDFIAGMLGGVRKRRARAVILDVNSSAVLKKKGDNALVFAGMYERCAAFVVSSLNRSAVLKKKGDIALVFAGMYERCAALVISSINRSAAINKHSGSTFLTATHSK